jgi:hypothetical protein
MTFRAAKVDRVVVGGYVKRATRDRAIEIGGRRDPALKISQVISLALDEWVRRRDGRRKKATR